VDEELSLPEACDFLSHFPLQVGKREALKAELMGKGIFASDQLFSRLLSEFPWLSGRKIGAMDESILLTYRTLHLPLFPGLKAKDQAKIIDVIQRWKKKKR
jgi:dTDP-4-amino-4,6-dideoxygalactose transaminase